MENNHFDKSKIKNLITRFYYKNNQLCFQIILAFEKGGTKLHQEFMDYADYKKEYDRLLEVKAADEAISSLGQDTPLTHIELM